MDQITDLRWKRDAIIAAKNEAIRVLHEGCVNARLDATTANRSTLLIRRDIEQWAASLIKEVVSIHLKSA